jgi:hypothetical protein
MCNEPGDDCQGNTRARTKHKLAFHGVERKCIHHGEATVTIYAYLTGKLCAFSQRFPRITLGTLAVR